MLNEDAHEHKVLVRDILKAGGIEDVSFIFFMDVTIKANKISIDRAPMVRIEGEYVEKTWLYITVGASTYFFHKEDNPVVRIDKETGGFVLIERDSQSEVNVSSDATLPLENVIEFFHHHGVDVTDVTDAMRQKIQRMQRGKRAFGM